MNDPEDMLDVLGSIHDLPTSEEKEERAKVMGYPSYTALLQSMLTLRRDTYDTLCAIQAPRLLLDNQLRLIRVAEKRLSDYRKETGD